MIEFMNYDGTYALVRQDISEDELVMRKQKTLRDKAGDIISDMDKSGGFEIQDPRFMADYNSWELNRQYYYQDTVQKYIPESFVDKMMAEREGRKINRGSELYKLSVLVPRDELREDDMDVLEFEKEMFCPKIEELYEREIEHIMEDKELLEKWMDRANLPQQVMHRMAIEYTEDNDYPCEWNEEAVDGLVWCAHEIYNYDGIVEELVEEQGLDEEEFKSEYKKQVWEFLLEAYAKKRGSMLEKDLVRVDRAKTEIYRHTLGISSLIKTCLRNIWCKCIVENIASSSGVGLSKVA